MNLTLNSDQLGKKGEARFSEICSDAKLTCNPSTYDRTGWDFIVEFPFGFSKAQSSLDKRDAPISCHVQVKTMWNSTDTFRMRLSSAERLAKEPKPTFVYVFKVNKRLEFVSAHLIHILDGNLARILKRLRKEHLKGADAVRGINKKYISFNSSDSGLSFPPTGEAIYNALESLYGTDPAKYIQNKRAQLQNLGFESQRYEGTTDIVIADHQELIDAFLGLKDIEITKLETFETRFGIRLPFIKHDFAKGTMHIQPDPADQCTIAVRENALSVPAIFNGNIFLPPLPNVPKELMKFIARTSLFEIVIGRDSFSFTPDIKAIRSLSLSIEEWVNFARMFAIFSKGVGTITITPSKMDAFSIPISCSAKTNVDSQQHMRVLDALESARRILQLAGALMPPFQLEEVTSNADQIIEVDRLFSHAAQVSSAEFVTEWKEGAEVFEKIELTLVNFVAISGLTLAYYAVADMTSSRRADRIFWKSRSIDAREIMVLPKFPCGYQAFVDQTKRATNNSNLVVANPP